MDGPGCKATNSIIVQATARQHLELDRLIKELDLRRKQVLIEAMIVEIANTDNLDLGVELGYVDLAQNAALFTQFGLSQFDPAIGEHTNYGGTGGNAAVLALGKVQAIIRALQATDDIRIQSTPQVLVNDNEAGEINNISQEPTRQTNVNNTVTTTAFSEYVDAGTRFLITPHISDYDYLHVDYNIELSSFGEKADDSLPPSKTTSSLSGRTTVPDGHTIIVGGIQTTRESESVDKVPLLGDIPLLGHLFRNAAKRKQIIPTYLFISTTIMKQDDFRDLKKSSQDALNQISLGYKDGEKINWNG
ncbi:type II secretion system protein GspD [Planctomycetota bacterium]